MKKAKLLLLLISLGIVFWMFLLPGPRVAGDFPYAFGETVKVGFNLPQLWSFRTAEGLGEYVVGTLWSWPADLFYSLGAVAGFSFSILERVLGILPTLILGIWGMDRLFSYFGIKGWGKWVGTLFYLINTYILLVIDGGQLSIGLAYSFFPISFLAVDRSLKSGLKQKVLAGLAVSVLGFFDIRFVYVLGVLLALRFFWGALFLSKKNLPSWILSWVKSAVTIGLIMLALNFYWILPAVLAKKPALPATYQRVSQASFLSFASLGHSLLLLAPHWYKNVFGKIAPLRADFILIPILVFLAPVLKRKSRQVGFWLLVSLVGVFLVKGANPPLPKVYPWLFANIPGFSLFRDPTKFFFLVALSYSLLIGVTVEEASKRFRKLTVSHQSLTIISSLFPILTASYFVFLAHPVWLGKMTGTFSKPPRQKEYAKVAEMIKADKQFGRVLWIPSRAPLGYSSSDHPAVEAARLVQKRPFAIGTVGTYELFNFLREAPFMGELFDVAAIKYIVYPFPDTRREELKQDNVDYYYAFLDQLSNLPWIKERISEPPVAALETKGNKNHFFIIPNTWWVVGSDRIYWDLVESGVSLSSNGLVFMEERGGMAKRLEENPQAKVILYDKELIDLAANFLSADKFIFPAAKLDFDPDSSGWWKREATDLVWWRNFLQQKYGLDNLDFDYGGGWAVAEGGLKLTIDSPRFKRGDLLLARVMVSSKGGKIDFYQGEKLVGSINTKIEEPQKVKIKLTGYGEILDQVFEYDKAGVLWFEVGKLAVDRQPLTVKTQGEINVVNALASVSENEWFRLKESIDKDRIIEWAELTVQEKKDLFKPIAVGKVSYKRISPTRYKVKVEDIDFPVTLAFSETYDSLWEVEGKQPLPLYGLINGFTVSTPGEYEVVFSAQKYVPLGLLISGLALSLIVVYLLAASGKGRHKEI